MLTFDRILDTLVQCLIQDPVVELVKTPPGYTILLWDRKQKNCWKAEYCATPAKMMKILLETYGPCLEEAQHAGNREPNEAEEAEVWTDQQRIKKPCVHK